MRSRFVGFQRERHPFGAELSFIAAMLDEISDFVIDGHHAFHSSRETFPSALLSATGKSRSNPTACWLSSSPTVRYPSLSRSNEAHAASELLPSPEIVDFPLTYVPDTHPAAHSINVAQIRGRISVIGILRTGGT